MNNPVGTVNRMSHYDITGKDFHLRKCTRSREPTQRHGIIGHTQTERPRQFDHSHNENGASGYPVIYV